MLDPLVHAEQVTGCKQAGLVDTWASSGVAVALSQVMGPHVYNFGAVPVPVVAITLYGVARHVLVVDGRVRRDGRVLPGRFRIGQPGRHVLVDAVPGRRPGKLLLMYLGPCLLARAAADTGRSGPLELRDQAWDTDDTFLHVMALRLQEVFGCRHPPDPLFADQVALTLALHLLDRYGEVPNPEPSRKPCLPEAVLARVIEFIRAQPELRPSLADLAAVSGLSRSHFMRCFRAATGMTPHRFVLAERVARAKDLLAGTDMQAAELALQAGFSSQSHLGTAFRAETGLTPAGYRRTARSKR